jgi:hypothetical protein
VVFSLEDVVFSLEDVVFSLEDVVFSLEDVVFRLEPFGEAVLPAATAWAEPAEADLVDLLEPLPSSDFFEMAIVVFLISEFELNTNAVP